MAKGSIPNGNTFIFPTTSHINTNPKNHEIRVVCNNVNLFAIINMTIAKHNDHNPQTAPLIGSEGNTSPRFLYCSVQYDFNKNSFHTNSDMLIQIVVNKIGKIVFFVSIFSVLLSIICLVF